MADTPRIAGQASGIPLSSRGDESPARVRQLAHEFEAMFLAQMLRQMRESMAIAGTDEEDDGFGKAAFTDTFDTELARHLSTSGGLGIADVIIEAFDRRAGTGAPAAAGDELLTASVERRTTSDVASSPRVAPPTTRLAPDVASTAVDLGPVSSAFGWRRDPLTGQGRFHKGIDIKAAYGQQVPSVAPGRVLSAGSEGSYGLSVVVEHDSGIRTRYAHLSELAVRQGEAVTRGQDLGRVGSTGRSTGPHLHFEVLEGGRRVDPAIGLQKLARIDEFKEVRLVADSSIGRVSATPVAEE
jgi:murein DD-endopeptidase MepM/ murein hydrolase activator NlpD